MQEFPLKSGLDPAKYGDPVSAISSKHIDGHLEGLSIEEVYRLTLNLQSGFVLRF